MRSICSHQLYLIAQFLIIVSTLHVANGNSYGQPSIYTSIRTYFKFTFTSFFALKQKQTKLRSEVQKLITQHHSRPCWSQSKKHAHHKPFKSQNKTQSYVLRYSGGSLTSLSSMSAVTGVVDIVKIRINPAQRYSRALRDIL